MFWDKLFPKPRKPRTIAVRIDQRDADHERELIRAQQRLDRQQAALDMLTAEVELRTRHHGTHY